METCSFLDYFEDIKDHRINRKKLYPCDELLLLTLCATISGAEGWSDVEDYGHYKLEFLRNYLPYTNGIPSDDTLRRFFRALDNKYFQEKFIDWAKSIIPSSSSVKLISIDGKTSRHSFDKDKSPLHMISAFSSEARIVMCQEKVSDKSNEITAIPNLLEWLDLRGAIVTIDAMGCQVEIASKIIDKGGDYIFSLKGNQGTLHEEIKLFFKDQQLLKENIDVCTTVDGDHGRIETRTCLVSNDINWIKEAHERWSSIKSIIKIDSTREIKGASSFESRYYISSIQLDASKILHAIRSHWAIENSLHWVLDMSFGDDQSRIRKGNAPQNMAIIRHVSLNMIRAVKKERQSVKRMRKISGWSDSAMHNIICQTKF